MVLGLSLVASLLSILLDQGPPAWIEALSVRWLSVRVQILSWLLGTLLWLSVGIGFLWFLRGRVLPRETAASAMERPAGPEALGFLVTLVFCLLLGVLATLAALPALRMVLAGDSPPTRLTLDTGDRLAVGSFVTLGLAADSRCRVELHRFGRNTQGTRQRWQAAGTTEGSDAGYVLRYVEAPILRGLPRLEFNGDTGYVAGPVPYSIRVELARQGCPIRGDAQLLIASRSPPSPLLELGFYGLLVAAAVFVALRHGRQPG